MMVVLALAMHLLAMYNLNLKSVIGLVHKAVRRKRDNKLRVMIQKIKMTYLGV